jgi:hypothetical protein
MIYNSYQISGNMLFDPKLKNLRIIRYKYSRYSTKNILIIFSVSILLISHVVSQDFESLQIPIETDSLNLSNELQQEIDNLTIEQDSIISNMFVDLSGEEFTSIDENDVTHLLAKPWYKNINISGFGGFGFVKTGAAGTRPNGGFIVKEISFFVETVVWDDISFFVEIQTNRLGQDSTLFVRTGEAYIHFRDLIQIQSNNSMGLKIGRVDIPFGEEYLWHDAKDNPLISNTAYYPYGWDEGILLYGNISQLNWIIAIMDGTLKRSVDDHPSKAFVGKIYGNLWDGFYISSSYLINGMTNMSAIEFGGSHLEPLGIKHYSTTGNTSSEKINATVYEVDAKFSLGEYGRYGHVAFSLGNAYLKDQNSIYNRNFQWFSIEPLIKISRKGYCIVRFSEIGTYNQNEGYSFDGKTTAGGLKSYGFDTQRLSRLSVGGGWNLNPRLIIKIEVGRDWFELIDDSPFNPNNDQRYLVGFEMVAIF